MPSIISGFEYDIFISYRQKDNKYDGWVTEFVNNLRKELEATFKDDVSIYFDENPHDGLLETHHVDKSLEGKLKCLIFIPILSQTYCDSKSFAWTHELLAFLQLAQQDQFGKTVKLASGNTADRFLPVRIHDLDAEDLQLFETATGTFLRPVDFIYRLPGVNRQLRAKDDEQIKSPNQILYRDQINKVAHAIKDIIVGLKQKQNPSTKIVAETKIATPIQDNKSESQSVTARPTPRRNRLYARVIPIAILAIVGIIVIPRWRNEQRAKNELLPVIQRLVDENFRAPTRALDLALEAEQYIPNDSSLIKLWPAISTTVSIETDPPGAEVRWKDYDKPNDEWRVVPGTTPVTNIRFPRGYLRIEISKKGYQTIECAAPWPYGRIGPEIAKLKLDSNGSLPEGMVRIHAKQALMNIVGLEQAGGVAIHEFLMDRFEVTNKQYKSFIDAGGYTNKSYWKYPIIIQGKEIDWESVMKRLVDRTGRPGPATWEAGMYPDEQGNFPVTGVSWYEAAAFASYADKLLPTVFHWSVAAETSRTESIVPLSNFNGTSSVAVGSRPGFSSYGVYDLAGNAREWCQNETSMPDQRFILGGGWNDPTYSFNDSYVQPSLDRSQSNGFRCIKLLPGDSTVDAIYKPVAMAFRDYRKEKPVDDKTFGIFLRQYDYDKIPLQEKIEGKLDRALWTIEKVSFEAGYNRERMQAYLFLPKNFKPPFQPVIFFPGSNDIYSLKYDPDQITLRLDFLLKNGRAIVCPVYKGTHERHDDLNSDLQNETVFYKDHVIMWRKDVGRTIDYLETRGDIDVSKLAYLGWSWGGFMGGIIPAIEKRIKVNVLNVGGMEMQKTLPEVDQINFLPRVTQPILMLNGKHDMFFPVETSQKPMFDFLGTPKEDKKIIIFDSGHLVPRTDFAKETLFWLDKYLGPVQK